MDDTQTQRLMNFLAKVLPATKPELQQFHHEKFPGGINNSGRRDAERMTATEIRIDLIVAEVQDLTKPRD
jgi:hypothetical protein